MEHMPRLHPDDLKEFTEAILTGIKVELRELHSREEILKENIFFSPAEAAKILGVHRDTVIRWCDKGILKAGKIGGNWRISQQTINDKINGNTK